MLLLLGIFITFFGPSVDLSHGPNAVVQRPNAISGHVSDERGSAVPDLQVELLDDAESVIQRTKTDGSGLYVFRRLSEGTFQIRVQTFGSDFISQTKRVQLERTRSFEQVDFALAKKRTSVNTGIPGSIFVQEVPELAKKQYERGGTLLQKPEQRNEGVEALKKAIEIFPQYFDALELLGTEYVKGQEYDAAIPVLTTAVEVNRRAYPSLYALSVAQHALKQLPSAVESMRRAITLNQSSVNANLWFGMLLRQSEKLDEAETYLKRSDKLAESKLPEAHWQLALLYNQVKKYKEAADHLELFLKIQPDSKDQELIKKLIQRFREKSAGK